MPQRFKLTIAYDGTAYSGWQIQPAHRTVQGEMEKAVQALCQHSARVESSGRTDSGVHARGQVAHVDIEAALRPDQVLRGLNALLNDDIRVMKVKPVASSFHARYSATGKEYRYQIWNDRVLDPVHRLYCAWVRERLDVEEMVRAAQILQGYHDFAAFTANPNREIDGTARTVSRLHVTRRGRLVVIRVEGDGFLYKMVRSLAGHLIRVGRGEVDAQATREILASKVRTARVPTAPANGLYLWKVYYGKRPAT